MAKYNQFNSILQCLKRCFSRSATHRTVLIRSIHPTIVGPRGGKQYTCVECLKTFGQGGVQVDHIEPVIPVKKKARDMSWNEIISRLFCDIENLQVLCRRCHQIKTMLEREQRKNKRFRVNKHTRLKF